MKPSWVPSWLPNQDTVAYLSGLLTALLLILVTIWIAHHLLTGGSASHAATTAAGVGVGGAGT